MINSRQSLFFILILLSSILVMPSTFAQNVNSINSTPSNAIRTSNGSWVTPLQTHKKNGSDLTTHYEGQGVDVTGKVATPPAPASPESISPIIIMTVIIIVTAVVGISVFIRIKKKMRSHQV